MTEHEFLTILSTAAKEIDVLRYQNDEIEVLRYQNDELKEANRNLINQIERLHVEIHIKKDGAE